MNGKEYIASTFALLHKLVGKEMDLCLDQIRRFADSYTVLHWLLIFHVVSGILILFLVFNQASPRALSDVDEVFPISDEKYAEELALQEALMSCIVAAQNTSMSLEAKHNQKAYISLGESSKLKEVLAFCGICMEEKLMNKMFDKNKCSHTYCSDCISKHIAAKVQENIHSVTCPDVSCKRVLDALDCQALVPPQVFDRWISALCEAVVLGMQRFYCPFKDCSAMMIDDGNDVLTNSECPSCRRLFCAQCNVSWHSGVSCEEFRSREKNEKDKAADAMAEAVALKNKWRRCPNCQFYVEKRVGCLHITCRCQYQFCYGCGRQWKTGLCSCG